jgi:hypothetical protein
VTARYRDAFPDVDIILGDCNPDLPFNRSEAILDGASKTTADTLILADGDCWSDGTHEAVAAVENGAPWAVPHLMLCRLSAEATERVLAGENPEDQDDFAERPYKGHEAGTLLVMNRATLEDIPPPVGMVGWGQDDDAWALALRCLIGPPVRGRQPCWHLHHPPQPRRSRGIGNDANLALYRRYKIARHDPARMRALVDEAKVPA